MKKTTIFIDGLRFAEAPRWHNGQLWFSDFYAKKVVTVDITTGERKTVCHVEGQPSGLGWLPDGRLLVVSMLDLKVMRLEPSGTLVEHADLSGIATYHANDMVVDEHGRAYVGNFGFDWVSFGDEHGLESLFSSAKRQNAKLAIIEPDGKVDVAAENMVFPNGSVLTNSGSTLVVAETFARRLTAFDVSPDGRLSNRRVWAQFEDVAPDGICIDAEGAIWVANALSPMVLRVSEGGEVLMRIQTSENCYAVSLGGSDGRTLYCCTAPSSIPSDVQHVALGKIEQIRVDVPAK